MPVYVFRCPLGHKAEEVLTMADRDTPQTCGCGRPLTRMFTPPNIIVDPSGDGYFRSKDGWTSRGSRKFR